MKLFGVKQKHLFLSSLKHHYSTFLNTSLKIIVTFHQMAHKRNIMIHYEAESLRLVSVECLSLMT